MKTVSFTILLILFHSYSLGDLKRYIEENDATDLAVMVVDMQGGLDKIAGTSSIHKKQKSIVQSGYTNNATIICVRMDSLDETGKKTVLECPESIIPKNVRESDNYINHVKVIPWRYYTHGTGCIPKDAFENGVLHKKLSIIGIKRIAILGSYTGICIQETIRAAISLGYHIILEPITVTHSSPTDIALTGYDPRFETLTFWKMILNSYHKCITSVVN